MSFSLPVKPSHDRLCDYVPDYVPFKISSQEKKSITDRYQKSLTDSESINDIGQPLLESSVIQSSALSASTEGISN